MPGIHLYLLFNGNCLEAFELYREVFKTEFITKLSYADVPRPQDLPPIPEADKNKIENIALPISKNTILLGSDVIGDMVQNTTFGNNFSIYIEADSQEEAFGFFNGLSQHGKINMPMVLAHWGGYFGMLTDPFGVNWFVNYSPKKTEDVE